MFQKVLIANRGEIALRIICACKDLGIRTVAVYSEADRYSLHVRFADEAICIGPAKSARSYLDIPSVISAAEITNADAVHPGYGFLSENPDFAEVCEACGLKFIGPRPAVIRTMGLKQRARQVMQAAGVPILPGSLDTLKSVEEAAELAMEIGYPVMLKASAGGGGRGMRIVRDAAELPALYAQANAEATAAFTNGELYMEKLVEQPRHIEFQILADEHGNVEVLGERECSIQRRHQKLIEEAPSPAVSPELRQRISDSLKAGDEGCGIFECRHRRIPDGSGRQSALHRSERPHSGGASGYGIRDRHRSGEESDHDRGWTALGRCHSASGGNARTCHRMPHQCRASRDLRAVAGTNHRA